MPCSSPLAPQLGLTSTDGGGHRFHRRPRVEDAALRRAAESDAFDTGRGDRRIGRGAFVEEHVDRPPPGKEGLRRGNRREHRILVVLAHRDDPHVDGVLTHQPGKKAVEPLLQPLLLHGGLFAKRAERPLGGRKRAGSDLRGGHGRKRKNADSADAPNRGCS